MAARSSTTTQRTTTASSIRISLLRTVAEETPEDTIIATDVGQHQLWSAQYNGRRHPRQFLTSGGLGTMGFGYGAAIGAQIAFPGRTVVHITGDGSFHMNLNEICTAVSYRLPIITVIMNNRVLGNVRQWQTMFYGSRYSQTDPHRKTDYVKLADAFGARRLPRVQHRRAARGAAQGAAERPDRCSSTARSTRTSAFCR